MPHASDELGRLLGSTRLSSVLDAATLAEIAAGMEAVSLATGETLFRQGDRGNAMYLLVEGQFDVLVAASSGIDTVLDRLGPGDVVDEMALLTDEPRSGTVVATVPATLRRLARSRFDRVAAGHPQLLEHAQRMMMDGDVLIDGGVMNNVPVDVARTKLGPGVVIASDARGSGVPKRQLRFGDDISGWRALPERVLPRSMRTVRAPSLLGTLMRANSVSSRSLSRKVPEHADVVVRHDTDHASARGFRPPRGRDRGRVRRGAGGAPRLAGRRGRPGSRFGGAARRRPGRAAGRMTGTVVAPAPPAPGRLRRCASRNAARGRAQPGAAVGEGSLVRSSRKARASLAPYRGRSSISMRTIRSVTLE